MKSFYIALAVLGVMAGVYAAPGPLSPRNWPPGDILKYSTLNSMKPGLHPLSVSDTGIVAGTTNALAIHAGTMALENGGNAMDACLAASAAQVVLAAGAYVSFHGLANIVYYDAETQQTYNLNGEWNGVKENNPKEIPAVNTPGPNGAAALIPGYIAAFYEAARRFGSFKPEELLEPALYFAETGFQVYYNLDYLIKAQANPIVLNRTREGMSIFTNPATHELYHLGENFTQPLMAEFLRNVIAHGPDYVYKGQFASDAVDLLSSQGSNVTLEDYASYQPLWVEPTMTSYQGRKNFTVRTTGTPNYGGVSIIEALNIAEIAGFQPPATPYVLNASALFWLIEISRFSELVSSIAYNQAGNLTLERYFPELNFTGTNRLTKQHAAKVWALLSAPGGVQNVQQRFDAIYNQGRHSEARLQVPKHSDGLVAMDSKGNVCSMVHTCNSLPWGTGLFVQGNAIPNSGAVLKYPLMAIPPGGRVPGLLPHSIAFDEDGSPSLAMSSVGSSLFEVTLQMLTTHFNYEIPSNTEVNLPKFLYLHVPPPSIRDRYPANQTIMTGSFPQDMIDTVEAMGQPLTVESVNDALHVMGFPVTATRFSNGTMTGGATLWNNGFADSARP